MYRREAIDGSAVGRSASTDAEENEQSEPRPAGVKHKKLEGQMLLRSDEIEGATSAEAAAGGDGWQTVFRRHAGRR